MEESEILILPDAETRIKVAEKIDLKDAVDARPCDCTACSSCGAPQVSSDNHSKDLSTSLNCSFFPLDY